MAPQVAKHTIYDIEHGFDLLEEVNRPSANFEVVVDRPSRKRPGEHSNSHGKPPVLRNGANDNGWDATLGWTVSNRNRVSSISLGKYIAAIEAELFAIRIIQTAQSLMSSTATHYIEITSSSPVP